MCKPPEWCKIEALHRRLYIWPEKIARRKKKPGGKKIRELLQMANIGSMEDIQSLFKETIAEFIQDGLIAH